jgi:hypothetical protein
MDAYYKINDHDVFVVLNQTLVIGQPADVRKLIGPIGAAELLSRNLNDFGSTPAVIRVIDGVTTCYITWVVNSLDSEFPDNVQTIDGQVQAADDDLDKFFPRGVQGYTQFLTEQLALALSGLETELDSELAYGKHVLEDMRNFGMEHFPEIDASGYLRWSEDNGVFINRASHDAVRAAAA